jgi:hypothetical protein
MHCPYDHDCLHCPLPDCKYNDDQFITKDEAKILKGAHGGWSSEYNAKLFINLKNEGHSMDYIGYALGKHYSQLADIKKKAARLLKQSKTAKNKTHNKSIAI